LRLAQQGRTTRSAAASSGAARCHPVKKLIDPSRLERIKPLALMLTRTYEILSFPQSGLTVHANRLRDKPDEIKRMIRAGIEIIRTRAEKAALRAFYRTDPSFASTTAEFALLIIICPLALT